MRITNKMMTNNMMSNINKNKLNMNTLEEQYSTGKKIQRPSDDPIVTVRALKLRTNLSELTQYYEKNIPDAISWMEVTESALTTVNGILSQINTYCIQGATDTLTAKDRSSIVENLEQMKQQIYQEGNVNCAGRYVFTGYKTDSSLVFTEDEPDLQYTIYERVACEDIQVINKVTGSYELKDFDTGTDFADPPQIQNAYRVQLSYDKLNATAPQNIRLFKEDASGIMVEDDPFEEIVSISASNPDAYNPLPGQANYIYETGEIILSSEVYKKLQSYDQMEITYSKTGFANGDLKPEHYFDCDMVDNSNPLNNQIEYRKSKQDIQYEVNYNQKITVNTEGSDAITHQIGRHIDDIVNAVNEVIQTENKIAEVEKRLTDTKLTSVEIERYNKLKEQLGTELTLKKEAMQKTFSAGITSSNKGQDKVNVALADLGSRIVRVELTENRLSSQKADFEDLLSKNEDVDIVETVIRYNAAETIYNASLSAASKIVTNTLLDFL